MEFDPKGIKWKIKICSFMWCQNFTKKFKFTTKVMVTKNAPLHIFVLRSIYNISSFFMLESLLLSSETLTAPSFFSSWKQMIWSLYWLYVQKYMCKEECVKSRQMRGTHSGFPFAEKPHRNRKRPQFCRKWKFSRNVTSATVVNAPKDWKVMRT